MAAVVAAVIGTASAMFLSSHDYVVVLWVCLVAGIVSAGFAALVGAAVVRLVAAAARGCAQVRRVGRYDAESAGRPSSRR